MKTLQYKFVETIPIVLEEGCIYISMKYKTAIHKCVCGCGNDVVTPFTPTDWKITFDGRSITLYPSIGNWNFECKSHYLIVKNEIIHCSRWTPDEIDTGRKKDKKRKKRWFKRNKENNSSI